MKLPDRCGISDDGRWWWWRRWLLVFVLGLTGLMGGCSSDKRPSLVIYVRGVTPAQDKIFYIMADAFQRRHPELQVKVLDIPYDAYWPKLFTMISSGNPPDLVLMESGLYPSFVAKGAFLDLAPLVKDTPGFSLDQYYPNALAWLRVGEHIYGLPTDTAVILPFYNQDFFDRYKVPYPAEDWTWDDYLEIAKKLTHDTNGDGKADVWGTILPPWEPFLWASGGDWVDNPDAPTRCAFDSPLHVAAIRWILDAREKYKVTPRETAMTAQVDPFLAQKTAIVWNGHWAVPDYEQKLKFRWDVATLPRGVKGPAGWNFGSCFSIPARSKHPKEAWEAVRFLTGPEGARLMAQQNFITPSLRAVAESPGFLQRRPPEHNARFLQAIQYGHVYPKTRSFQELRQMINNELERVWAGDDTPEGACQRIGRKGTEILKGSEEDE